MNVGYVDIDMRFFRKLIRDKMPAILAKKGKNTKTRVLEDDGEYFEWLRRKMIEELQEMTEKQNDHMFHVERFAYLHEILFLMMAVRGIEKDEIKKAQKRIIQERGSFKKRLLLE